MTCTVEGCDRPKRARGWCSKHWQRWRRNGHPTATPPRKPRSDAAGHGTRRMYDDHGCRCLPCAVANSRYYQQWKNGPTRVPVDQVVEHIGKLVAQGWTYAAIAREAGIGPSTPWHLRSGRQQSVNRATADKITALPLATERRWLDPGPLAAAFSDTLRPLTALLDVNDRRVFYRAVREGRISEEVADRLAIRALGAPLELIYPDMFDEVAS